MSGSGLANTTHTTTSFDNAAQFSQMVGFENSRPPLQIKLSGISKVLRTTETASSLLDPPSSFDGPRSGASKPQERAVYILAAWSAVSVQNKADPCQPAKLCLSHLTATRLRYFCSADRGGQFESCGSGPPAPAPALPGCRIRRRHLSI